MSVAVVTDSAADIPRDLLDSSGIRTVPIYVRFGSEQFRDGVDMTADEFFARVGSGRYDHPNTSQPSPGDFAGAFKAALAVHDYVVSVHISSGVSGTYSSALQGANEADPGGTRITSIDSRSTSMGTGWIALTVADAVCAGSGYDDAVEVAKSMVGRTQYACAPMDMDFVRRTGRMRASHWTLDEVLHSQLLIGMLDGELVPLSRVRSHRRAGAKLVELVEDRAPLENLAVLFTTDSDAADVLSERLGGYVKPGGKSIVVRGNPARGINVGPGAVGVCMSW